MTNITPVDIEVPFRQNKVQCPICHKDIVFIAVTRVKDAHASTTGGTNFHTNLSVSFEYDILRIETEHTCDYKKE